jgi:hypothetical protein
MEFFLVAYQIKINSTYMNLLIKLAKMEFSISLLTQGDSTIDVSGFPSSTVYKPE